MQVAPSWRDPHRDPQSRSETQREAAVPASTNSSKCRAIASAQLHQAARPPDISAGMFFFVGGGLDEKFGTEWGQPVILKLNNCILQPVFWN